MAKNPFRFYVYGLKDPRDGQIFYVGKGTGDRSGDHVRASLAGREKNRGKSARILEIINCGLNVEITMLETDLDEESAFMLERAHIDKIGRKSLTNITSDTCPIESGKAWALSMLGRMDFEKALMSDIGLKIVNELFDIAENGCPKLAIVQEGKKVIYGY